MSLKLFSFCGILFLFSITTTIDAQSQQPGMLPAKQVRFSLRNNSWWFRKFTIITYKPEESGNDAQSFLLAPGMSRNFMLPAGTRLYNAESKQVEVVMSGATLTDKPFLIVQHSDAGKIIPLLR